MKKTTKSVFQAQDPTYPFAPKDETLNISRPPLKPLHHTNPRPFNKPLHRPPIHPSLSQQKQRARRRHDHSNLHRRQMHKARLGCSRQMGRRNDVGIGLRVVHGQPARGPQRAARFQPPEYGDCGGGRPTLLWVVPEHGGGGDEICECSTLESRCTYFVGLGCVCCEAYAIRGKFATMMGQIC